MNYPPKQLYIEALKSQQLASAETLVSPTTAAVAKVHYFSKCC